MIALSYSGLLTAIAVLIGAFAIGSILSWPMLALLRLTKSRQTISEYVPEHAKKQGTPTMGGIVIVFAMCVSIAIYPWWFFAMFAKTERGSIHFFEQQDTTDIRRVILVILAFAFIGFLDDFVVPRILTGKRGLGWIPKLAMQFAAAATVPWAIGWELNWGSLLVVALVVLFFCNAYNFTDGMDGLAGSVGFIFFGAIGILGLLVHMGEMTLWAFAICGAIVPFLFMNAPPAKVFMGDVGSLPIGALAGILMLSFLDVSPTMWGYEAGYGTYSLHLVGGYPGDDAFFPIDAYRLIPALLLLSGVFIIELVPVPLQILGVKILKRRLFLMTPIHHAFEKKGWNESKIVWTFALTQLVLAMLAIAYLLPAIPIDFSATTSGQVRNLGP